MKKCSYIIYVRNNEPTVLSMIESLKVIKGNFLKEFIVIDDGSTDNSLQIIKNNFRSLPKVTIITQKQQGPSISINKAIRLAQGDYVQFVYGDSTVTAEGTAAMMNLCEEKGAGVVFGCIDNAYEGAGDCLITEPIKAILTDSVKGVRGIGLAGSMVKLSLLEQIKGPDNEIYPLNMSLSLKCALYSKFAFLNRVVAYSLSNDVILPDLNFESYNNLQAIYNFIQANPKILQEVKPELIYALHKENSELRSSSFLCIKYFIARYLKLGTSECILQMYRKELDRLF